MYWAILDGTKPKQPVPKEVQYYVLCKEFKCLPTTGGLLDQDPHVVEAFILCMNIEGEHQAYKEAKDASSRRLQEKMKGKQGQR